LALIVGGIRNNNKQINILDKCCVIIFVVCCSTQVLAAVTVLNQEYLEFQSNQFIDLERVNNGS